MTPAQSQHSGRGQGRAPTQPVPSGRDLKQVSDWPDLAGQSAWSTPHKQEASTQLLSRLGKVLPTAGHPKPRNGYIPSPLPL